MEAEWIAENLWGDLRLAQHHGIEMPGRVESQGPRRGAFTPELGLITLTHAL